MEEAVAASTEATREAACEGTSGVDQTQGRRVIGALARPARQRRPALENIFGLNESTETDPIIDNVDVAIATCIDTEVVPEMRSRLSGSFIRQIQTQLRYTIDSSSAHTGVAGSRRRQLLTEGREG